jgi:N-acyl-D-amino-acid deacylase
MWDYLLTGGTLIDGTGRPGYRADLAVEGGKIAAVGRLAAKNARAVIQVPGRAVTPGFLDIHRHADAAVFRSGFGRLELKQGLTSIVNGNCGLSLAPCPANREAVCAYLTPVTGAPDESIPIQSLADYQSAAMQTVPPLNLGMLAGAGTIRAAAAGYETERLDSAQVLKIHALLEQALAEGALGVSLGLGYAPECFYTTDELIAALRPLEGSGRVISVHMRQEGSGVVGALDEMLTVAAALRTPVHISHLKAIGKENWGKCMPEMLQKIARAREDGLDVSFDVYPYTAGSTQLQHILPPECQKGGTAELTKNLQKPAFRRRLRERMETGADFENISRLAGWDNILLSTLQAPENARWAGKSILDAARDRGQDPFDCAFDLLVSENCEITMIDFIASEDDIALALQSPYGCVISDSLYPTSGLLHPRVYGTYARLFERYVREKRVLTLEQAVEKVTSKPAALYGLKTKGVLEPGSDADLCVFDPAKLHEAGTYENPARFAEGMEYVFVNGVPAIAAGEFTGSAAGKIL